MKDNLIIIGAGSVGGFLALNLDLFNKPYNIVGFLDDDEGKVGKSFWNIPVLGKIDSISNYPDHAIVIGISNPQMKQNILSRIGDKHRFPSFISRNAWISNKVKIGQGVIIYPGVSVNYETEINDFVVINMNCAIGHNCIIQKCSSLAPGVNFGGFTNVGPFCQIGIGTSTIQQIKIGEGAIIGGQSILIADADKYATYIGVPAIKK